MTEIITRKPGKMPDKPLPCEPLIEVLQKKLKGEKGGTRKWLRCKIKELMR